MGQHSQPLHQWCEYLLHVCPCLAGRLASAKESLVAAKKLAAEQEGQINQIEQDLQQQRCGGMLGAQVPSIMSTGRQAAY